MDRTIVIGDLQGCYHEALQLLDKCRVTPRDHVIFAGDLVDRGPESGMCVELAMRRERVQGKPAAVLGNHESKHLSYREREEAGQDPKVSALSHVETRKQLKPEHYDYLRRLPLYLRLPEHNAVVVHAGVYPGRSVEEQRREHLLHIQMINPPDEGTKWPNKAPEGWRFWTNLYDGPELVIFGHTVFDKPLLTDKLAGIDGGACFGRALHAFVLPGRELVSVPAQRDYGKGSRGQSGSRINLFKVHGDISTYS